LKTYLFYEFEFLKSIVLFLSLFIDNNAHVEAKVYVILILCIRASIYLYTVY